MLCARALWQAYLSHYLSSIPNATNPHVYMAWQPVRSVLAARLYEYLSTGISHDPGFVIASRNISLEALARQLYNWRPAGLDADTACNMNIDHCSSRV